MLTVEAQQYIREQKLATLVLRQHPPSLQTLQECVEEESFLLEPIFLQELFLPAIRCALCSSYLPSTDMQFLPKPFQTN